MKKNKYAKRLTALLLAVTLAAGLAPIQRAGAVSVGELYKSSASSYDPPGSRNENLFRINSGYERVEWEDNGAASKLHIEDYSDSFKPVSVKTVGADQLCPTGCSPSDLIFGAVYEGADWNFVCTGRNNESQSETLVTLMVTRFDKNWNYSARCEMNDQCGVEIYNVFDFASCKMLELGDTLYLSTGREGFAIGDYHHQGKVNVAIHIPDMKYTGSASDFWHSFDQYLAVCNGQMYQMEISDGDRAVIAEQLDTANYTGLDPKSAWTSNMAAGCADYQYKEIFNFYTDESNGSWSYAFGGSTGGLAASDSRSRIICVGNSVDQTKMQQTGGDSERLATNVWIRSVNVPMTKVTKTPVTRDYGIYGTRSHEETSTEDVSDLQGGNLTNYADGGKLYAGVPQLAKINDDKFLVIWNESDSSDGESSENLRYIFVNAMGQPVSGTYSMKGYINGVEPVNDGKGGLVWYATDGDIPTFYQIAADGSSSYHTLAPKPKNSNFSVGRLRYQVTKSKGKNKLEVTVCGVRDNPRKVSIPASVKYMGYTYRVTSVTTLYSKKLKKLTIGKHVKKIERFALDCKKLKNISIKSKKIKKIGYGAFMYCSKKLKITVPKSRKKKYKKLLRYSGYYGKVKTGK